MTTNREASSLALNQEQSNEDQDTHGDDDGREARRIDLQTFDCAEYGYGRRDDTVSV